jgi:hypothetical protein
MISLELVFLFAGIIILGALICAVVCLTKRGHKYLNVDHYRAKCLENEHLLKKDDPSTYQLSVVNADKLVDQALREMGCKGQTMGERMRSCVEKFSDRNGIWMAHKLRNQLVHETDVKINYDQARVALYQFRKALKDLGAI